MSLDKNVRINSKYDHLLHMLLLVPLITPAAKCFKVHTYLIPSWNDSDELNLMARTHAMRAGSQYRAYSRAAISPKPELASVTIWPF